MRQTIHRLLRTIGGDALEFCFPAVCCGCDVPIPREAPLCRHCQEALEAQIAEPACPLCAAPAPYVDAPCGRCVGKGITPFDSIVRLAAHEGVIRRLIHVVKYQRQWSLAEYLARRLARMTDARDLLATADLLVPVPLRPWRQMQRGFNQAEVIAKQLARLVGGRVHHAVLRTRGGPAQMSIDSRAGRARNVRGAFSLASDLCRDRVVAIVDDVMTSGATLRAVAREVQRANPKRLHAIVLGAVNPLASDLAPPPKPDRDSKRNPRTARDDQPKTTPQDGAS